LRERLKIEQPEKIADLDQLHLSMTADHWPPRAVGFDF
jgi:hypothetical protein